MFDPVKVFSDIAVMRELQFMYGARHFQNWELTQKTLTAGDSFLGMFPFTEQGQVDNGSVSTWAVSTIIWIGRKFDPAEVTHSSMDETEEQKYERRLKYLRSLMEIVLSDLCASSYIELLSARVFRELNKFDECTDVIGCELSFSYDPSYTN